MSLVKEYTDRKTGKKYPVGGCIVNVKAEGLPIVVASPFIPKLAHLPASVNLKKDMTPVEHQGSSNSCSGNAVAGIYEFLIKKITGKPVDVSRLFIYFNGRLKDGHNPTAMQDCGASIPGVITGMQEYGCCSENIWKYFLHSINRQPSHTSYNEAKKYRVTEAKPLPTSLMAMKSCLAEGYPFVFALKLFESFFRAGQNKGRVPIPQAHEKQAAQHGWHALVAVGYSDRSRSFLVRNSWGSDWGDKGYCYIPYTYMANPGYCQQIYMIKKVSIKSQKKPQVKCGVSNPNNLDDKECDDSDSDVEVNPKKFWVENDTYNYYLGCEITTDLKKKNFANASTSTILWIDTTTNLKEIVDKQLRKDMNIKIDFCQNYAEGTDYLVQNVDDIQSSMFQIVCLPYYQDENKSALDLLDLLIDLRLNSIPILVITKNKVRVISHLTTQASEMDLDNWKDQIFITEHIDELATQIEQNFRNKK